MTCYLFLFFVSIKSKQRERITEMSSGGGWSCCPFCSQQVLSTELQRHANSHFDDDDFAMDTQLANYYQDQDIPQVETDSAANTSKDEVNILLNSQLRDTQQQRHDFIALLKDCLECDASSTSTTTSLLSGYVDHFQSLPFQDVGWGCGWRNIQMLTSHLLKHHDHAKHLLFGGASFVPDIPSLQRWLQLAWDKGFDSDGSNDFHKNIYGKRSWIGTTECAALLRSFGLRARIVDFCSSTTCVGKNNSKSTTVQLTGPMDRYMNRPAAALVDDDASTSVSKKEKCLRISPEMVKGHQLLTNWVWSYFSDNKANIKSGCNQVVVTHKPPLYFQHDGHSRTIVGIQLKSLPNGTQQPNLLILDPAHKTQVLESCLTKKVGWQRFIKRGVHTLKKTEYQLCYVDPGIASGPELEKLKILDSTRFEF